MARYQIAAINYIASGSQRTLLNIDTQLVYHNVRNVYILDSENTALSNIVTEEGDVSYLPTEYIEKEHPLDRRRPYVSGKPYKLSSEPLSEEELSTSIILNEQQKYGYDTQKYKNKRILLYLSSNTEEYEEKAQSLNDRIYERNRTFEIETSEGTVNDLNDSQTERRISPAYDIRDVSIKSCVAKSELNSNLTSTDGFVDVYAPPLSAYPVGFCQCAGDAYVMTERVNDFHTMMYSSLNWDRAQYDAQPDFYTMRLSSEPVGVYLYENKEDLGVSSYAQLDADDMFRPSRKMTGIGHNYIIQVNQRQYASDYEKGDVYAQEITPAKNTYNALYSMEMHSVSSICACRAYCGIGQFNDNVYLKYYDNVNFQAVSSYAEEGQPTTVVMSGYSGPYPFQKVEMYLPNSFKVSASHKSNLFSVKIKNKGIARLIEDETAGGDVETREKLYAILKKDIKNACKQIADRAAPANTQFFDVFFEQ